MIGVEPGEILIYRVENFNGWMLHKSSFEVASSFVIIIGKVFSLLLGWFLGVRTRISTMDLHFQRTWPFHLSAGCWADSKIHVPSETNKTDNNGSIAFLPAEKWNENWILANHKKHIKRLFSVRSEVFCQQFEFQHLDEMEIISNQNTS